MKLQTSLHPPVFDTCFFRLLPLQAMFKDGDDMRQDQLVLQIITLMDKVLYTLG